MFHIETCIKVDVQMASINLLFIAPYPELATLAKGVARELDDVSLTVHTGDLDEGVRQALADYHTRFDAVISRGGTAETLEDELSVPVIKMQLSVAETLDNLKRANPDGANMAAVGFAAALEGITTVRELLPFRIDLYPADFDDEIPGLLDTIERTGYPSVLCDNISYRQGRERGLPCHLLMSSEEGVRRALNTACEICRTIERERSMNLLLWHVINNLDADFAIYDETGRLAYSSIPGGQENHGVLDYIAENRGAVPDGGRLTLRRGGRVFTIRKRSLVLSGKQHAIFTITHSAMPDGYTGIDFMNEKEVRSSYDHSVFATVGAAVSLTPLIRRAVGSRAPLLLEGETGSGKDQIARLVYLEGAHTARPFVQVSCDLLNERAWKHLIKSHKSPIFHTDITLYLRGLHALNAERWRDLLTVVRDSAFTGHSRLIMSCSDGPDGRTCDAAIRFAEQLRCTVLIAPPLRSAPDVPDRLERYLARLAREEGAPAPAIEPDARAIASQGAWRRNYLQLREVAERLYAVHGGRPISARLMTEALARGAAVETRPQAHQVAGTCFEARRDAPAILPLAQRDRQLAQEAVELCNGNKTQAAAALGISRTTLWRLLSGKDQEAPR